MPSNHALQRTELLRVAERDNIWPTTGITAVAAGFGEFTMAFSTRIERAKDGWVLDGPVWLHEPPPKGHLEWADVSRNLGYADYAASILAADLLAWHQRDRYLAFEGVYADSGWVPIMTAKVQALEQILAEAPPDSEFMIVRYEWESGFND